VYTSTTSSPLVSTSSGLGEDRAHVGRGPVLVVRRRFDEDRDAARAVALVHDLLELLGLAAAGRLVDRPLDIVGGHVHGASLLDREAQPVVGVGVTAALARCHGDLARNLGEGRAALGIRDAFRALDRRPFGVSGHRRGVYRLVLRNPPIWTRKPPA
jgi:hypothetical protein